MRICYFHLQYFGLFRSTNITMVKLNYATLLFAGTFICALAYPRAEPHLVEEYFESSNESTDLAVRETEVSITEVCAIIATGTGMIVGAAGIWAAVTAHKAYMLSKKNQCGTATLTRRNSAPADDVNGTVIDATAAGGELYILIDAYTTGNDGCHTTALEKTIVNAYTSGANQLHDGGARAGCCTYKHGNGDWRTHVKVKTSASRQFSDIVCPSF